MGNPTLEHLGTFMAQRRRDLSLRQTDLMSKLYLSKAMISRRENGHHDPGFLQLLTWAKALGMGIRFYDLTTDDKIGDTGTMANEKIIMDLRSEVHALTEALLTVTKIMREDVGVQSEEEGEYSFAGDRDSQLMHLEHDLEARLAGTQ